jgi:hypothetical protein
VARGDDVTVRRHVRALPRAERRAYRAMADAARTLAEQKRSPGRRADEIAGQQPGEQSS